MPCHYIPAIGDEAYGEMHAAVGGQPSSVKS